MDIHTRIHQHLQVCICGTASRGLLCSFSLLQVLSLLTFDFYTQLPKHIINTPLFCFKDCVWDVENCRKLSFDHCIQHEKLCCKYFDQLLPSDPFGGISHWMSVFATQGYSAEEFCWAMAKIGRLFVPVRVSFKKYISSISNWNK